MAATTVRLGPPPILRRARLAHPLWGLGGQFDTDLFTELGQPGGIEPEQLGELQATIDNLRLGHSRIFVRAETVAATAAGRRQREALMRTIQLAQHAHANVNLTWWHGPYPRDPRARRRLMDGFARIVEEARQRGHDCVTHLTIQNEVNNQDIARENDVRKSMELYSLLYDDLEGSLLARPDPREPARSLRAAVQLVGGDLVDQGRASQDEWLAFMQRHMTEALDGYSIHAYWSLGDLPTPEGRLTRLVETIARLRIVKPVYVTEFGVRGTDEGRREPGTVNGHNVEDLVETGFEHAWFAALAPQHGCVGLSKWALYRTNGPRRPFGGWGMIDAPSKEFARTPTYRVVWLFNRLVDRGWKPTGLGRSGRTLVSAFGGPRRQRSLVVLNGDARAKAVRVVGLEPRSSYSAAVWNRSGDGAINGLPRVAADAAGAVTVTVPRHGLVALSTRRIPL